MRAIWLNALRLTTGRKTAQHGRVYASIVTIITYRPQKSKSYSAN